MFFQVFNENEKIFPLVLKLNLPIRITFHKILLLKKFLSRSYFHFKRNMGSKVSI